MLDQWNLGWVFDVALVLAACAAIGVVVFGSIFGFTYNSKRRRRHRHKRRNKGHRRIDILRKNADPAADPGAGTG